MSVITVTRLYGLPLTKDEIWVVVIYAHPKFMDASPNSVFDQNVMKQ